MRPGQFSLLDVPRSGPPRTSTLPVSVVETGEQSFSQRTGDHDGTSSRAEHSPFPFEIASLCMELFLRDAGTVVDPFAGWGERHKAAEDAGLKYVGTDLSPGAIAHAREMFSVTNHLADCRAFDWPEHGGLLTCPPYWNLESYEGEGLHQAPSWLEFCEQMESSLLSCMARARARAVYCVAAGSWRHDGVHYDMPHALKCIFYRAGWNFHDSVIISRLGRSKVKVMIPQALRLGYTVRVHEELLVFKRGEPDENTSAFTP